MTLMNEPIKRAEIKPKYCRFKKNGIKYIDYKDPDFLLKFIISENTSQRNNYRHYINGGLIIDGPSG